MFFYLFPSPNKNNTDYRNETKKCFTTRKKCISKVNMLSLNSIRDQKKKEGHNP